MNRSRILILGVAALAAGAAVLLVHSFLGGGAPPVKAQAAPLATIGVLVASSEIEPGRPVAADMVRWQAWPKSAVDSTFLTQDSGASSDQIVKGTVARTRILSGQPLTDTEIVHSDSAGVMAAMVAPGMRAVSIPITVESDAGGFILPNDRVDVLVTLPVSGQTKLFASHTLLHDVRVLAVDQTYKQDKNRKTVLAKTATLELSPEQAEAVNAAAATGTVSLSLRPLGDQGQTDLAMNARPHRNDNGGYVSVIRYGVARAGGAVPGRGE